MRKRTLPRLIAAGTGWSHPYGHGPFSPVLYADGGGGDGGSGSDNGAGGTGDGGGDGAGDSNGSGGGSGSDAGQGSGDGGSSSGKDSGQGKDDDLAATVKRLEKELADARRDAGKARTDAKKQAADDAVKALTQQLGKALGFVKDDTPPDPAKLAEAIAQKDTALSQKESVIRAKDVELAVWARADKLQAKAGALLDSRSFISAISSLDPSDKGFQAALDQAIKDAVKNNPAFAATASAGKSGGDLSGGTGEGATKQRAAGGLAGAIRGHYQT
ncbi:MULTISPECIES: hypothetical protein [Streptomyces]|uniref:hypothetical protein n=1 Tax=Streptomyces TaxID=1883 RepID=UPI00167A2C9A|nr:MULTISPECIES: hypothetical protein [Streptomyces]MBK3524823.1 hypothetical protein [Streptomyces sp. MBT70]GGR71118.1 hypothetical protein GCM10010236_26760 [Streptomyces eurythermus]